MADDRDADRDDDGSANHYLTPAHHGEDTYISAADGDLANQTERDAVSAVLRHYYTAAAAGDGTIACTMLAPSLASGLAEGQAQSGQRRAQSCAAAMSLLFKQQRGLLEAEHPTTMVLIEVQVNRNVATATVGFKATPIGKVHLEREHGAWKMRTLFDTGTS